MLCKTKYSIQKKEPLFLQLNEEQQENDVIFFSEQSLNKALQAEYLAFFLIETILNEHIRLFKTQAKQQQISSDINSNTSPLIWTNPKAHLIELAYSLYYGKTCNEGQAKLIDIIKTFQTAFNVELNEYRRTFSDIKNRKRNGLFLQHLVGVMQVQIDLHFE